MRWLFRLTALILIICAAFSASMQENTDPMPSLIIHDAMTYPFIFQYAPNRSVPPENAMDYKESIGMWGFVDGELVQLIEGAVSFQIEWSPDCTRYILMSHYGDIENQRARMWINTPDRRDVTPLTQEYAAGNLVFAGWSPDNTTIVYYARDDQWAAHVMNAATGDTRLIASQNLLSVNVRGWLGEHQFIVGYVEDFIGIRSQSSAFLMTLDDDEIRQTSIPGIFEEILPDPANHNRFISVQQPDPMRGQTLDLYDVDGSFIRTLASDVVGYPEWSPDGRMIAVLQNVMRDWILVDADTGEHTPLITDPPVYFVMGWSGDSTHLIYVFFYTLDNVLQQGIATYNLETGMAETLITVDPTDPGFYDFRVCIP